MGWLKNVWKFLKYIGKNAPTIIAAIDAVKDKPKQ